MGPDFTLQSEMVQDEPAEPLRHGSSERTRQGSFQQQRDRYNDYWTLVLFFYHFENHNIFSQSVGCLISTEGMVQSQPLRFLKNFK